MPILIFHPSVAPFVQQAARALEESGRLDRFVTTLRDDPRGLVQRFLCGLGRLGGRDLRDQFRRRAVTEVSPGKVESRPFREMVRLAAGAADRDGRLTDLVWEWAETGFDRRVSRTLTRATAGVYGFEHSSLDTFRRARELGVPVIYDVPAPESRYVHELLEREMLKFPELRTPYHVYTEKREERRIARRRAEWKSADLVIAASRYTRRTYELAGLDVSRVRVVPYGAPPPGASNPPPGRLNPPTFIWAGTFGLRKGAHYLLDAWQAGGFGRHARLLVFGAVALPPRALQSAPEGIEFRGAVSRAELLAQFERADALLFPTLCDGFGMVATEAWSRGLPVITTEHAGAADLLQAGRNGLLIPAADAGALQAAIQWCLSNRPQLHAMRESATATAASWQWSDYRKALIQAIGSAPPFDRA